MNVYPGQRFTVVNLGCKVNRVESDTITARLASSGCIASSPSDAQFVVVNTCTVTAEADKKTRKAVRRALREAPHARVIVTGCAATIDAEAFLSMDERVEVVQRFDLLASLPQGNPQGALRFGPSFRTRVNVKVQDGCNHTCTYCIVHVARGRATSVPLRQVLAEASPYLEQGAKEIVLAGIDLGSYADGDARLAQLVEELIELADRYARNGEPAARIRVSSIEPDSIEESFGTLLASAQGRLCRHLHVPLQSGSTKVLGEMARSYTAAEYLQLISDLREKVPSLSVTTDVIAGFPGETDDDFDRTLEVARRCGFSKMHVFPYSPRAGTPAASRPDQVDSAVKAQRASRLRKLSDELRAKDLSKRRGSWELALVEGQHALTESYHEIASQPEWRVGSLVKARLD